MIEGRELKKLKTTDEVKNKVILGDALEVMKKLPKGSVDLVMTSPPYNLDGAMTHSEYVLWQRKCLRQMMRVLKEDGAIFYSQIWRVQHGLMQDRREIVRGLPVRQVIIWKKPTGVNFNKGYFLPTYEVIYLIAKPGFVLAAGANKFGDVWEINPERGSPHPNPQPIELTDRIVESSGGQLVLDPFAGSGTSGLSALRHNRDYILIDIDPDYCEMARRRLSGEEWGGLDDLAALQSTLFDEDITDG